MNTSTNLFSLKKNYDAAIAGLIGALLIFLYTRHGGIGMEPDSIVYLSTARSVAHGGGFVEFEGIPITDFPVGYPAFLGIFQFFTRVDILQSAPLINMALFFTLIYLCGGIINHISTKNRWIKIPFLFLIVFSPLLLGLFTMIYSETLFLVLILLFFVALHHYGKNKTLMALAIMALVAAYACVVRYAGITLVGAGGMMILFDRQMKIGKRLVHLILFGMIGVSLMAANLFRNYLLTDELTGEREKSLTSLVQNIENYARVFANYFHYHDFPMILIVLLSLSFFIFYVYSHLFHIYKIRRYYNYWNICATYFVVYTVFIILIATLSRFDPLNNRLLAPLYLPCLLPFTFVVTWTVSKLAGWKKTALVTLLSVLFVMINLCQYNEISQSYAVASNNGIPGYAEDYWREHPLLNYLKKQQDRIKPETRIYSDANEAVYLFLGHPADIVPHVESADENSVFKEDLQRENWLVWFYEKADPELQPLDSLLKMGRWVPMFSSPEGRIYWHPAMAVGEAAR